MAPHSLPLAVAIMGPTASGKSRLAMALASEFPVEIVSVDSAQVYRGMDIGTAKPNEAERSAVRHHLIDIIDPTQAYSAARFHREANEVIADISARGRLPLLTGGTMLYFRALRDGLSALPEADPAMRAQIDAQARERGWPALHAELARIDPDTGARLSPSDSQRIQRALEILRLTGIPPSKLLGGRAASTPAFRCLNFALLPTDRAWLHQRIAERFDTMLRDGLVEELSQLRQTFSLTPEMPSMRCAGYRQTWQYLVGEISHAEMRDRGVFATRQLAKRQITWLRSTPDLHVHDPAAEIFEKILQSVSAAIRMNQEDK